MGEDLGRFLADEPIQARRVSAWERYWRWARRNPWIATLGAVLTAVLVTATIASLFVAERMAQSAADERWARRQAEESQKREAVERESAEKARETAESSSVKAREAERLARAAEEQSRRLLYTTDLQLVPFIWNDPQATAAQLRSRLNGHDPAQNPSLEGKDDLRGFEWHYYRHLLENSAAVFSGHGVAVVAGAFDANGQLVTLDENARVGHWDLDRRDEEISRRRDLPGVSKARGRVLSSNGRLAVPTELNNVHVFDTSIAKEMFQIDFANVPARSLIVSRDGDRLVIVNDKIRWLSAVTGEVLASIDKRFNTVNSLALSADGLTLAVVGHGRSSDLFSIFRLDATSRAVTPLAKDIRDRGTMYPSAMSPNGQRIAVSFYGSGRVSIFDTATGREIAGHRSAHGSPITALSFSDDGAELATADTEGTIKIWADPQKLTSKSPELRTLKGHQGRIRSVVFSRDGKRLLSISADKTARVWDPETAGAAIRRLDRAGSSFGARFSPDGQLIALADGGRSVRLWDTATGRLVRELSADNKASVSSVAFSPNDRRLLAVGYGGKADVSYVGLWDIAAGKESVRLQGATDLPDYRVDERNGAVAALAFSPDGQYLVAGFGSSHWYTGESSPSPLKVWGVATRRLIRCLHGHTGSCVSLAFSRDGRLLASASHDRTAIIWSTETWERAHSLQNPTQGLSSVEDVAFSPDGKTLAMASHSATAGNVYLWDDASGTLLETLRGHSNSVEAVAFSPDGRTLASGGSDQTVRLWNVATRRELMRLDPGNIELGQVWTLAFSPDGKLLLAGGTRNTAIWSAAPIVRNKIDRAARMVRLLHQFYGAPTPKAKDDQK